MALTYTIHILLLLLLGIVLGSTEPTVNKANKVSAFVGLMF